MLAKLLIVPVVFVIGFLGWQIVSSQKTTPSINNLSYSSPTPIAASTIFTASKSNGSFTIKVPAEFKIEEKAMNIILANNEGQIVVGKYASNYLNLDDHLNDLHNKNKVKIIEDKRMMIDGLETALQIIEFNSKEQQKTYFIFSNGYVYDFVTNSSSLYSALDQIAQSFTLPK